MPASNSPRDPRPPTTMRDLILHEHSRVRAERVLNGFSFDMDPDELRSEQYLKCYRTNRLDEEATWPKLDHCFKNLCLDEFRKQSRRKETQPMEEEYECLVELQPTPKERFVLRLIKEVEDLAAIGRPQPKFVLDIHLVTSAAEERAIRKAYIARIREEQEVSLRQAQRIAAKHLSDDGFEALVEIAIGVAIHGEFPLEELF